MSFLSKILKPLGSALGSGATSMVSGLPGAIAQTGLGIISSNIAANKQQKYAKYWAAYNTPAEQMQRLKDAGLNPNLVYGNGQVANTSEGSTSFDTPRAGNISEYMLAVENAKNLKRQNDLLQAQEKGQRLLNANQKIKNASDKYDLRQKQYTSPENRGFIEYKTDYNKYLMSNYETELKHYGLESAYTDLNIKRLQYGILQETGMDEAKANLSLSRAAAQIANINARYQDSLKQLEVEIGKRNSAKIVTEIANIKASIGLIKAQTGKVEAETALTWLNASMQSLQNTLFENGITSPSDYSASLIRNILSGTDFSIFENLDYQTTNSQAANYAREDVKWSAERAQEGVKSLIQILGSIK